MLSCPPSFHSLSKFCEESHLQLSLDFSPPTPLRRVLTYSTSRWSKLSFFSLFFRDLSTTLKAKLLRKPAVNSYTTIEARIS